QMAFLNVPGAGPVKQTVTIVQNTTIGALSGAPKFNVELPAQMAGLVEYSVNYGASVDGDGQANDISVTFTAVPEPAALAILPLAASLLRRRQRSCRKTTIF